MANKTAPAALLANLRTALKAVKAVADQSGACPSPNAIEMSEADWAEAAELFADIATYTASTLIDAGYIDEDDTIDASLEAGFRNWAPGEDANA